VTLLYLWLPTAEAAIERVARRVREGGHNIAADVIVRRYGKGIANMLTLYLPLADVAAIYDNSDAPRVLVAERKPSGPLVIHDRTRWSQIERSAA
jgi:predicted ABC-type ATPase